MLASALGRWVLIFFEDVVMMPQLPPSGPCGLNAMEILVQSKELE